MSDIVVISIRGGVADVVEKPSGVTVIIKDYDIEGLIDGVEEDDSGRYREEVHE